MQRLLSLGFLLAMLAGSPLVLYAQLPVVEKAHSFVSYTEIGALFGRVAYPAFTGAPNDVVENKVNLTIQTFNGARLLPRLAVGGIVGIDWYNGALLLPVGAGLRYDLTTDAFDRETVRLFACADVGYGLTWLDKASTGYELTQGGLMLNPGIGLRFGKPGKGAFVLSVSYKRQVVDVARPLTTNDIRRDEHRVYNRLAVRFGVNF